MKRKVLLVAMLGCLAGCVSPYARMDSADVRMLAEDRYAAAAERPGTPKENGFYKVYALNESMEATDNIRDDKASVELDGNPYHPAEGHKYIREQVVKTEKTAGITPVDYAGKVGKWLVGIPVTVLITPVQAVVNLAESPVL